MFFRLTISCRAISFTAQQRKRRPAMLAYASAPLINLLKHTADDVQRKRQIAFFRNALRMKRRAGKQRVNLCLVFLRQRFLQPRKCLSKPHQSLRHGICAILHKRNQIHPDIRRSAHGFKKELSLDRLGRTHIHTIANEPERLLIGKQQFSDSLTAVRAGAFVSILRPYSARIQAAYRRQNLCAKLSLHAASSILHVKRAIPFPRRRNLRIGFRRGMQRHAHGSVQLGAKRRRTIYAQQTEIIIRRYGNRPSHAAGVTACPHLTGKFRIILRNKIVFFHRFCFMLTIPGGDNS